MASGLLQSQRARVLTALFQNYQGPLFAIRMWDGWRWTPSPGGAPACTIAIETPKALAALAAEPNEIALGEAFIHRDLEIEGDIFAVFPVAEHLLNGPRGLRQQLMETLARTVAGARRWLRHGSRHSMARDRSSISYHTISRLNSSGRGWANRSRTPARIFDAPAIRSIRLRRRNLR